MNNQGANAFQFFPVWEKVNVTVFYLILLILSITQSVTAKEKIWPRIVQVLENNQSGIKGLDNVRALAVSNEQAVLAAVSADDNALSLFKIGRNFELKPEQVIFSKDVNNMLEGAVSLVMPDNAEDIFVSSFYSGSLARFSKSSDGQYQLTQVFTDHIDAKRIFVDGEKIHKKEDVLGLLGPYDVTSSGVNGRLFTVSFVSGAVSSWNRRENGTYQLGQSIEKSRLPQLRGVQAVASDHQSQLVAVSSETDSVLIFEYSATALVFKRMLSALNQVQIVQPTNAFFLNSSLLLVSTKSRVLLFEKSKRGEFNFVKDLQNDKKQNLSGITHFAISPDGKTLVLTSESEHGLHFFINPYIDEWQYASSFYPKSEHGQDIIGTSAAVFSDDGVYLAAAHPALDRIIVYQLRN